MLDSIHNRLSVIEIAKQGFSKQSEARRDRISGYNYDITSDSVRDLIEKQFQDMTQMMENHKNYLLSEIDKIDQNVNQIAVSKDDTQIDFQLDYKDRMFAFNFLVVCKDMRTFFATGDILTVLVFWIQLL